MRIHILVTLFLAQLMTACQHNLEKFPTAQAKIDFESPAAFKTDLETAALPADSVVFQSTDGGQTWQDISIGLPRQLGVNSVLVDRGKIYLATERGLYHSAVTPGAADWEKEHLLTENVGLVFPGPTGLYAYSYDRGLFQEALIGTGLWKRALEGMKDQVIRSVLQTDTETIFVGTEKGIFKSADGGDNWKQVFSDGMVTSLVAAQGVLMGAGMRGVVRSADNGEHWDLALTEDGRIVKTTFTGQRFISVSQGAYQMKDIKNDPERGASRMRTSFDAGKTWQRIDASLMPIWFVYNQGESELGRRQINDVNQIGDYLFCSLQAGAFRSGDQGKTWEFSLPSSNRYYYKFAVAGKVIYAVRSFSGC